MKKARCVPTIVSAALSLAFPLHSVFSYLKKKVAYRAPAAQACTPPTWTINRIFSKSEILAESLIVSQKKKKKKTTGAPGGQY